MTRQTYKKAGVDIDKANLLIKKIKPLVKSTKTSGSIGDIGAFAGFFKIDFSRYKDPLIVSSTDGVGTKLLIARQLNRHDTVGIDLVAMNANDIVTCGAQPLFFLDYFATGSLKPRVMYQVMKGITRGCKLAGCALIGGETAELPGMFGRGVYDLSGFCVGVVDRDKVIDGSKIKPGNLLLGIQSSGLHSNGFSLVRRVFSTSDLINLSSELLTPTVIYVRPVLELVKKFNINGIAHITGGSFYDNIVRILPINTACVIYRGCWSVPQIFGTIQKKGNVSEGEMYKVFNMGIGMVLILPKVHIKDAQKILLNKYRLKSWLIGEIIKGKRTLEVLPVCEY